MTTLLVNFLQLLLRDTKSFPDQLRDIIPPASPGSTLGSLPNSTCLQQIHRETSRKRRIQIFEPLQLAPVIVEEQWLLNPFWMSEKIALLLLPQPSMRSRRISWKCSLMNKTPTYADTYTLGSKSLPSEEGSPPFVG